MQRSTLITILITLTAISLTFYYDILGFLWLALIIICLALIFIAALVKIFYRQLRGAWFRIPFICIIICLLGVFLPILKPKQPALPEKTLALSAELDYILETDQNDRTKLVNMFFWTLGGNNSMKYRDSIRLIRVLKLVADSNVTLPQDEYNAALVLQHGNKPEHYELAHKLSTDAAKHHIPSAEWLSQATWDRWQMSIGKPQKYGTQYSIGR